MAGRPPKTHYSPKARAAFLEHLAESANVTASAQVAGRSRDLMYKWRAEDPEFAAAWDSALEAATDTLEAEARRRAFKGVRNYVVSAGKIVTSPEGGPLEVHEYSDTLMIALLKAHRPTKFRERVDMTHAGEISLGTLLNEVDRLRSEKKE